MLKNKNYLGYMGYAFGEIMLLIVGILIALQIDNWHSERQEKAALQKYMGSVARNMSHDLKALDKLRTSREQVMLDATSLSTTLQKSLDVEYLNFASKTLGKTTELKYFNSVTSGYQALRVSGLLGNLQGEDVEALLFDYYDTVDRIARIESDHNALVKELRLQLLDGYPEGLEEWEFISATALSVARVDELQPLFRQLITSRAFNKLMTASIELSGLVGEYDKVIKMGNEFIRLVESGQMTFDPRALQTLKRTYDPSNDLGNPAIFDQGRFVWHDFTMTLPDSTQVGLMGAVDFVQQTGGWDFKALRQLEDSVQVFYPGGANWAALSIQVLDEDSAAVRTSRDFSMFDTLKLELKGSRDGDTVLVNIKDSEDPDDGSQTNVELELSSEWQTYEISLNEFTNADPSELHMVLAFLFLDGPQTFYIRSARYF